MMITAMYRLMM